MAGRPKKDSQRLFYDAFYELTVIEQERALAIMTEHHEYVKREVLKYRTNAQIEHALNRNSQAEIPPQRQEVKA